MQWTLMVVDVQFFLTVAAAVEQVMEYAIRQCMQQREGRIVGSSGVEMVRRGALGAHEGYPARACPSMSWFVDGGGGRGRTERSSTFLIRVIHI